MAEAIEHEVDENLDVFLDVFRRIALVLVEMSDQFLLPGGQDSARACAGALLRRDRTLRFLGILNAQGFAALAAAGTDWASGTPSSATSLIFVKPPTRRISSTSIRSP